MINALAILAAYNDADIIFHVVRDLADNGLLVYVIDNGSTDATVSEVERAGLLGGLAGCETFQTDGYQWGEILKRKEVIALQCNSCEWYLHVDSDEFRESPWPGVRLLDAIERVDREGYNAIDHTVLNFWPTVGDDFRPGDDVRQALLYYERAAGNLGYGLQIKTWKRQAGRVDLHSMGGHDVSFPGRRVHPVPFIIRHYPLRSAEHARRKIFDERLPRFSPAERANNWHYQYDQYKSGAAVLREREGLMRWNG